MNWIPNSLFQPKSLKTNLDISRTNVYIKTSWYTEHFDMLQQRFYKYVQQFNWPEWQFPEQPQKDFEIIDGPHKVYIHYDIEYDIKWFFRTSFPRTLFYNSY